jgi:hypothetical protein
VEGEVECELRFRLYRRGGLKPAVVSPNLRGFVMVYPGGGLWPRYVVGAVKKGIEGGLEGGPLIGLSF